MIERHNILALLSKGSSTAYHSALLTCYTFDPIFFSTYYLPILRNRGINNLVVYMDASQYDAMMQELESFDGYITGYTLVRMPPKAGNGVFHSKVSLLIGEKQGTLFVGSGNLTYSGMSLNDEVWCKFDVTEKDDRYGSLFAQAWHYLSGFELRDLPGMQLGWMIENADWLQKVVKSEGVVSTSEDGAEIRFLAQEPEHSIFEQLKELLAPETIQKMDVISPFYDDDCHGISHILSSINPNSLNLVVETDSGTIPHTLKYSGSLKPKIYKWNEVYPDAHKLHAKIFQFSANNSVFLYIGSANATRNALGLNPAGYNDEAGILIKDGNGRDYIQEMGISQNPSMSLSLEAMKDYAKSPLANKPMVHFEVHIHEADIIDGQLIISVDRQLKGDMIVVADGKGREQSFPYASTVNVDNLSFSPRYVFISRNGERISNNYLVHKEDEILRCNPNMKNAKLKNLIDKVFYWDDNIAAILGFIRFETPTVTSFGKVSASKDNHERDKADTKVGSDRFDHLSSRAKSDLLNSSNVMIADIFNAIFNNGPASKGITDTSEKEDEEAGNTNGSSKRQNEYDFEERRKKSIVNVSHYLRKMVEKHYQDLLPDPQNLRQSDSKLYATLNDYAAISVSNHLILFSQSHDSTYRYKELKELFVSIMGKTTLLFKDGFEYDDSDSIKKMREMLKQFITSAVLLFSHFTWSNDEVKDVYLVLLNTLELSKYLSDDHSITAETYTSMEAIMSNLLSDAERNELSINDHSLAMVKNVFDVFFNFKYKSKEERRKPVTETQKGDWNIIYLLSYGYVAFEKYVKNNVGFYQFKCYRPAFKAKGLPDMATTLNVQYVCSL